MPTWVHALRTGFVMQCLMPNSGRLSTARMSNTLTIPPRDDIAHNTPAPRLAPPAPTPTLSLPNSPRPASLANRTTSRPRPAPDSASARPARPASAHIPPAPPHPRPHPHRPRAPCHRRARGPPPSSTMARCTTSSASSITTSPTRPTTTTFPRRATHLHVSRPPRGPTLTALRLRPPSPIARQSPIFARASWASCARTQSSLPPSNRARTEPRPRPAPSSAQSPVPAPPPQRPTPTPTPAVIALNPRTLRVLG
ncbi:hypothetical protein B0H10DRAFT_845435 [Mycena sp. CBHHK59/15]|nr:hypothetical protein B0H10DRAFT_845435 [Mycena sp. CBHHK59/15]